MKSILLVVLLVLHSPPATGDGYYDNLANEYLAILETKMAALNASVSEYITWKNEVMENLRAEMDDILSEISEESSRRNDINREYTNNVSDQFVNAKNKMNDMNRNVKNQTREHLNNYRDEVDSRLSIIHLGLDSLRDNIETHEDELDASVDALEAELQAYTEELYQVTQSLQDANDQYRETIKGLARQTMLQQFQNEEKVRSDGDSGIKLVRGLDKGPQNFWEAGAIGFLGDRPNHARLLGMAEVVAAMNGVEFRTRSEDFRLQQASTTSRAFHATEDIAFPDVPPEVLQAGSVEDQTAEMHQWFKAFATQNTTLRPYKQYFKPVLCYMEATWLANSSNVDLGPEASDWRDMEQKSRHNAFSGGKSRWEDLPSLPTTILSVDEETGLPQLAYWDYRVLCSPLRQDIPFKEFRQMDDLSYRVPRGKTLHDVSQTNSARFRVYEEEYDTTTRYGRIDELFSKVPGKDNIPRFLSQASFGETILDLGKESYNKPLNTGYYHRFFRFENRGAMGLMAVARGFNDANMWVAQTTQEEVAAFTVRRCSWRLIDNVQQKVCEMVDTRFSYAIPLEIVFLTPLHNWNPFNLTTMAPEAVRGAGGERTGRHDAPFHGVSEDGYFYRTPTQFFQNSSDHQDSVYVEDADGDPRAVDASGTQIVMHGIPDVGSVRLRYPIAPLHGEGASVWKELNALKHVVIQEIGDSIISVTFRFAHSVSDPLYYHSHELTITFDAYRMLTEEGEEIEVMTSEVYGHRHRLLLGYDGNREKRKRFHYVTCDFGQTCDGHHHPNFLILVTDLDKLKKHVEEQGGGDGGDDGQGDGDGGDDGDMDDMNMVDMVMG